MLVMSDASIIDVNLCGVHSYIAQSDVFFYGKTMDIRGIDVKVRQRQKFTDVTKACVAQDGRDFRKEMWPAFSLSPGIFRVSAWTATEHWFSVRPEDWPWVLEYKWACKL